MGAAVPQDARAHARTRAHTHMRACAHTQARLCARAPRATHDAELDVVVGVHQRHVPAYLHGALAEQRIRRRRQRHGGRLGRARAAGECRLVRRPERGGEVERRADAVRRLAVLHAHAQRGQPREHQLRRRVEPRIAAA